MMMMMMMMMMTMTITMMKMDSFRLVSEGAISFWNCLIPRRIHVLHDWQMMTATLHCKGQQSTEKDGDTEKGCQKPAVQQKTTAAAAAADDDDHHHHRHHHPDCNPRIPEALTDSVGVALTLTIFTFIFMSDDSVCSCFPLGGGIQSTERLSVFLFSRISSFFSPQTASSLRNK